LLAPERGYALRVETLYSLTSERAGGGTIFDFVIDRELAGWWRHDFDHDGYAGVSPASTGELRETLGDNAPRLVIELRCAAATFEDGAAALLEAGEEAAFSGDLRTAGLLARRAGEVQRARIDALDEVVRACDAAWEDAIARVERARASDDEELQGALRTVELLWSSRLAVRRLLAS
jgi:hypothetical protein